MQKECLNCGKLFHAIRQSRKFCNNSCKTKAYNSRHGFSTEHQDEGYFKSHPSEIPFQEIHSPIISDIKKYAKLYSGKISRGYTSLHYLLIQSMDKNLKCIYFQLLHLSYQREVHTDTYAALYQALDKMLNSSTFSWITHYYSFKNTLIELKDTLHDFMLITQEHGSLKLIISRDYKIKMLAHIYLMDKEIPLIKFSEITY